MQIKHTFLLTLVLGFALTTYVFAYSTGPDTGYNGVFGASINCTTCHNSFAVNSGNGGVTLTGQPTSWAPGQTYPLTVTVVPATGSTRYGFQLSAVVDSTNQQAGTLEKVNNTVQVACGPPSGNVPVPPGISCSSAGAIQFAEHTNATSVRTWSVNWTAPSTASVGTVRFNLAGNAANGDFGALGDRIYTQVYRVDPAATVDLSTRAFTMVDRGGVSLITDGSGALGVGYSRIQPNAGSTTPAGVAIFGLRQNNTVVTEAGVPASPRLTSVRIYAEVSTLVNTGVAIANPNNQPANINFQFTDNAGVDFGGGTLQIGANQQIANFLNEAPFNVLAGRTSFQGTFSFTSDVEVSVIALRGLYNERVPAEFLITTLPITNLSAAAASGTVYLPHFADGGGWRTQIVLVNPTDATITGGIQFFGQGSATAAATPLTVTANGQTAVSFNYSIPRRSSFKLVTAGLLPSTLAGSVRVTATAGAAPSSLVVFSYKPAGITVSEAGVPGIQGSAFRMYAEETATGGIGAIQTGLAIANLDSSAATVNLELTDLTGASTGQVGTVTVPGNGQVAKFLHELFPGLSFPFKGVLRITGGGAAGLSVVGLRGRYNERGDFLITTTPPTNEATAASAAELLFPHLVNGGGYTTQFILFSGTAGQASNGNLKFFKQDGTALNLTVN